MNKIVKLTLVLFLVCAVVAGVLGGVYVLTADTIEAQRAAKENKAYATVLESENGYAGVWFDAEKFPSIDRIAKANNGAGYVVVTTFSGAQGSITMAVGVDKELKCTGISIIEHSETSGLGANAASSAEVGVNFRAQFVGQDESVALKKSGGEIDALTGATITSRSVTNAVAEAIRVVTSIS